MHVHDDRKRALLFKFRAGIAPLRIETGRYESTKGIPVCKRTCLCCNQGIEDEQHFLCTCPSFSSVRDELFSACKLYNDSLSMDHVMFRINLEDSSEFFNNIMSTRDCSLACALANFIWKAFKIREDRLKSLLK